MPNETPATFFSYSREDSEFALRLAQDLRQQGVNIWLDQLDIGPGQRWDSAVEEALRSAPRQVVILSPAAVSSVNVMDEVAFDLEDRKQIIPVLYRDCQIPLRLRRLQHIDFRTDYDRGLRDLLKALAVKVQAEAPEETRQPSSKKRWIIVGAVIVLAVVAGVWYAATNHQAGGIAAPAPQSAITTAGGTLAKAAEWKEISRITLLDVVRAVAFSADGRYVATGSDDKTARVFEAASGKEVLRLTHEGQVYAVTFSADGRYLATAGEDKTARVFEAASGKEVLRLTHEGQVHAVAFSADGRYVATGSSDQTARVFEAASGKEVARLTPEGEVYAVAFSADGRYLAIGSRDTARVFQAASREEVARLTHEDKVYAVAFSADGRYLATGSKDRTARVFEVVSWKQVARITHESTVFAVAFSADGRYVATGSKAFSADGHYVAEGKTARVFEAAGGKEVARLTHEGAVYGVAFSADGRYLATGCEDHTARVFEAQIMH
jgi:uncharacterized delta-60 repeat protein